MLGPRTRTQRSAGERGPTFLPLPSWSAAIALLATVSCQPFAAITQAAVGALCRRMCAESSNKQRSARTPHIKKTLRPDWLSLPPNTKGGSGQAEGPSTYLLQLRRGGALHLGVWDYDFGATFRISVSGRVWTAC